MDKNTRREQMAADSDPVVEDAQLPAMDPLPGTGDVDDAGNWSPRLHLMDEPPPSSGAGQEENPDMQPLSAAQGTEDASSQGAAPVAHPADREGAAAFAADVDHEGYVRLLVEVDGSEMRILDASIVEGALVQPELTGVMAYEVTIGDRRVGSGAFDDLTEQHAYAPPDEETLGHLISNVGCFQFTVRIPRSEITLDELSDLRIALVRPQTTTQLSMDIVLAPGVSFENAAVESGVAEPPVVIAEMEGINLDALPSPAAEALRRGLR